jgi:hypothetical protein
MLEVPFLFPAARLDVGVGHGIASALLEVICWEVVESRLVDGWSDCEGDDDDED